MRIRCRKRFSLETVVGGMTTCLHISAPDSQRRNPIEAQQPHPRKNDALNRLGKQLRSMQSQTGASESLGMLAKLQPTPHIPGRHDPKGITLPEDTNSKRNESLRRYRAPLAPSVPARKVRSSRALGLQRPQSVLQVHRHDRLYTDTRRPRLRPGRRQKK